MTSEERKNLALGMLADVRNYLDMTWVDVAGDYKLSGLVMRGMVYLDGIAGEDLDYSEEGQPRALLFDYCRYGRSNALDEFAGNYQHELLALQMASQITRAIEGEGDTA